MRIGIVGAQGVGKTTLIEALLKEDMFKGWCTVQSPTRYLKQIFGMDIDNANAEIQLATLSMQIYNSKFDNIFYDRTVIDNFAYLNWYAAKGKSNLSGNALNYIHHMSWELANMLDFIFVIPIEFGMEDDGVRNLDPDQQMWIQDEIFRMMSDFQIDTNKILRLSGTVEQRVLSVKKTIKEISGERDS